MFPKHLFPPTDFLSTDFSLYVSCQTDGLKDKSKVRGDS